MRSDCLEFCQTSWWHCWIMAVFLRICVLHIRSPRSLRRFLFLADHVHRFSFPSKLVSFLCSIDRRCSFSFFLSLLPSYRYIVCVVCSMIAPEKDQVCFARSLRKMFAAFGHRFTKVWMSEVPRLRCVSAGWVKTTAAHIHACCCCSPTLFFSVRSRLVLTGSVCFALALVVVNSSCNCSRDLSSEENVLLLLTF